MRTDTPNDASTVSIGFVRCGSCGHAIYRSPLKPPPPQGSVCPTCYGWAVRKIVDLHKRPPVR